MTQLPDDRFSPATLAFFSPNFRCSGDVEIPHDWRRRYHWDHSRQVADAIDQMIQRAGRPCRVFEGPPVAPPGVNGWRVPRALWDTVMGRVVGVQWDRARISDAEALALLEAR